MNRGFSTLEMLIAMALLISAFTVTLLLSSSQSLSVDTQTSAEALTLARKTLENEQSLGRKDFKLVVATTSTEALDGTTYTKTTTVAQPDLFTKKVTTTISWPGTFGRHPSTSLTTLITNFSNAVGGETCSTVLTDTAGAHGNWSAPTATNATFASIKDSSNNPIDSNASAVYPLTDIDAYQNRLYASVSTASSALGPNNPATAAADTSVGSVAWSSTTNVKANDGSYATATVGSGQTTQYIKATNFGFTVPKGATILSIQAEVERKGSSSTNTLKDYRVRIIRPDGSIGSVAKEHATSWPTSEAYDTYTWTASDLATETGSWNSAYIDGSNFGVVVAATVNSGSSSRTASVDHIRIIVTYTKQFYILDIKNPAAPVFLGGLSTSTLSGGMNALVVATSSQSNYVYVATDATTGTNQLQVIDVKNPAAPYLIGTYPSAAGTGMGKGVGTSIFYKDGYAYEGLTTGSGGPEFNIIDVSTPGSPQWKGGYTVGNTVNAIVVKDGYAYLSTNDTTKELIILNITNPSSPTLVTNYNATPDITNFGYGRGLYTVGDTVYLGRSWTNSSTIPQFLSIDASTTPVSLKTTKSLGTNYSLRTIIVRDYLAFFLLGSTASGGQLQIMNVSAAPPTSVSTVSLPSGASGIGGVSLDCEGNYLYAASVDSANKGYITSITGS